MDKYEVIGTLGEGSFGRVYKAKQVSDGGLVALKVISKRGRSVKELKGFRRECQIQRNLHHPNIIQMLDSFETDNEIVVITEFAPKELTGLLTKGCLSEEKVQPIVWDLLSALYYLHSNRVLHRDLKPQNILLDLKNRAKLCDFGFARNMSTGTHVLTSIKGTPLYMAPELIDELPYDYTADLWSLGCIVYELLMGNPPFCTHSILYLIKMIKHKQIDWPTSLSPDCTSFLKGLLQKNPSKRLTWEQILNHPYVKGHILITKTNAPMPLTGPLTASTQELKEQQRKDSINNKYLQGAIPKTKSYAANNQKQCAKTSKDSINKTPKCSTSLDNKNSENLNQELKNSQDLKRTVSKDNTEIKYKTESNEDLNKSKEEALLVSKVSSEEGQDLSKRLKEKLNFIEDNHPIEPEEWVVFLQKTILEVMNGEVTSLTQQNLTNIIVSPLRNSNSNSKVLTFVAKLLSIAFVVRGIPEQSIEQIKKVYLEVKLLSNLIYSTKLLMRNLKSDSSSSSFEHKSNSSNEEEASFKTKQDTFKSLDALQDEELEALESIFMLVCHLVYLQEDFVTQFCDSVVILNVFELINSFLGLAKRKLRITMDIISILTQTIRTLPDNTEIIEKVLLSNPESSDIRIHLGELLRSANPTMRERTCYFILFMGKYFSDHNLEKVWSDEIRDILEALMYDSIEGVRNVAEAAVKELKQREFYDTRTSTSY